MRSFWRPIARNNLARRGIWEINGVKVDTPTLLVVVDPDPRKQLVPIDKLKELGIKIIMTSSFIARRKVKHENLKASLGWEDILYTDSGTYQAYSQGVKVDPLDSVNYQVSAGADIITPVDEFSLPKDNFDVALKKALISFYRWKEARDMFPGKLISAPVQGGLYTSIRGFITRKYVEEGAPLIAIGGIVPLMVNYRFDDLVDTVMPVIASRPQGTVIHAFGAGHPLLFPLLVAMGVDVFDSAMYILAAKDGRYLTPWGTLRVEELSKLREFPCDCPVCSSLRPKDLEGMSKTEVQRFLAYHNLYVALNVLKDIREKIEYGTFYKWFISFSHSHPRLYEGVYRMHSKWRRLLLNSRDSEPKTTIPNGFYLSELTLNTSESGPLTDLYFDYVNKAYGIQLDKDTVEYDGRFLIRTNYGKSLILPSAFRLCPETLLNLGLVVRLKSPCKEEIRKKDVASLPKSKFGVNAYLLAEDVGGMYCIVKSLASLIETLNSKDGDIIFIRSSTPSPDPSAMPCKTDKGQQ